MADAKKAMEMYDAGLNCGQIVTTFLSEPCGFDEKTGRAAMGGFGMGLYNGEVCGAVVGALYALGMYCNHSAYNDEAAKMKIAAMTKDFTTCFLDKFGSLRCVHFTGDGDHNKCWTYIAEADSLVRTLLEEDKLG